MSKMEPTGETGATIEERVEKYLFPDEPVAQEEEEAAGEVEAEAPETDAGEAPEGPQITTTDLAAMLGVEDSIFDTDEDGGVIIKTKIDGEEGSAKLQDVIASYQLKGHVDNQSREVADQKKALQAQAAQAQEAFATKMQEVEYIANAASQELMGEFNSINWQELRVVDPAEYAAKLADFQQKQAKIAGISQHVQAEKQRMAAEAQAQEQTMMVAEAQKMKSQIPGWSDEAVAKKEWDELESHVQKELAAWGEQPDSLSSVKKAFHINILRKAMLYDKMQENKAGVEKMVRTAPKLVKPGQAVATGKSKEISDLKANIKKTGGSEAAVSAYLIRTGIV
jgi:hypothetical protein